jgi:hypothetical protein
MCVETWAYQPHDGFPLNQHSSERREVLKLAGACLIGTGTGCAPSRQRSPATVADVAARLDPRAADALLAKIDRRMQWIDQASLPEEVLPLSRLRREPDFDSRLASDGALVRKAIRTLYFTGRFLDMPEEMKVHPGVQSRLRALQPEMDDAVLGMTDRLERRATDADARIRAHLSKDDAFGESLARVLERTAKEDGLSFQKTFGVRAATLDLTQRMAAQSPGLVIDPLVSKVRRIQAHPRSDAEQARRLAARVGEQVFWANEERITLLHDAWASRLGSAAAIASTDVGPIASSPTNPAATPPAPQEPTAGQRTIRTGGITMGFGLGSVMLGLILAGIAEATSSTILMIPAVVLGVTIGPILLVVGLVIVLVGLAMRATE